MERVRRAAFGVVVVVVLAAGVYLAFGDFLGQRGATATAGAISVQSSMAGFGPPIHVKAGQAVKLDWWTNDAAPHLQGGVHTMISDELGLSEELPAAGPSGESRRLVAFTAPSRPGEYDIYCDTCCGGKASPTMHGKIVVDAA
jgi:plastocyanin